MNKIEIFFLNDNGLPFSYEKGSLVGQLRLRTIFDNLLLEPNEL
jgi:hypothetical protein